VERRLKPLLLAAFLAASGILAAQGTNRERAFADWLYESGRYDEAFFQYHRAAFFESNLAGRFDALRGGLRSRLRAGKSGECLAEIAILAADPVLRGDAAFLADCRLASARALLMRRDWTNAERNAALVANEPGLDERRRDHGRVLQGAALVWNTEPQRLAKAFHGLGAPTGDPRFAASWEAWRKAIPEAPRLRETSPFLAGLCAFFLPGSGHWMSGAGLDGLQAFLIDGTLIAATTLLLREDLSKAPDAPGRFAITLPVGLITLFIHGANVTGAVRASLRGNEMAKYRFRLGLAAGLDSLAAGFSLDL